MSDVFDDRGVSDVVGFVLIFSLIILTVGAVYTAGFDGLTHLRQAEQSANAERAFEVLANNVEDLVERGAPSRGTELQLSDARLTYGETVTMNLSIDGGYYQTRLRPIVYETGTGTRIVYTSGAVIRQQSGGSVALKDPGFVFGERTVVPYIVTRPTGRESVGGSTRVLVRTDLANRYVEAYTDGPYNVTLNVTTERWRAWNGTLSESPRTNCSVESAPGDAETVSCSFDAKRVYVQVVEVDVHFI